MFFIVLFSGCKDIKRNINAILKFINSKGIIKNGADKHCPPRSRNKWMYDSYSFLFLARMVAMIFSVVAISANIVLYDCTNSLSLPLRQS